MEIPKCSKCGATMKQVRNDLWGCPNWKPNNAGCEGSVWKEGKAKVYSSKAVFTTIVESKSNPGKFYKVDVMGSGDVQCHQVTKKGIKNEGCVASEMKKFCRHKKEAAVRLKNLLVKIKEKNNL
jgi:hypothetical protein